MINRVFCILALLTAISTHAGALEYPLLDAFQLRVQIYEKVFEKAYTSEQIEHAFQEFHTSLEKELALITRELIRVLPEEEAGLLKQSQRSWQKYLLLNDRLMRQIYNTKGKFPVEAATLKSGIILQRIEDLYILLQDFENRPQP